MTDLTLYEYYNVSEEELGQILQAEAKKMFKFDSPEYDFRKAEDNLHPFSQRKAAT